MFFLRYCNNTHTLGYKKLFSISPFCCAFKQRGKTFILGNCENSEPNKGEGIDLSKYDNEIKRLNLDEVDADRYYKKKAFEWIQNNPKDFMKLYLLKFFNYFNYRNELIPKVKNLN